jgi:hypothetical protein
MGVAAYERDEVGGRWRPEGLSRGRQGDVFVLANRIDRVEGGRRVLWAQEGGWTRTERGSLLRAAPGGVADPDVAVLELLGLPDRGAALRLIDGVAGGFEGCVAVG